MKKYIVSFLVASIFLAGAPFAVKQASASDLSIRDFVNLLIIIGVIPADKIPAVNAFLATLDNSTHSTTTPINTSITPDTTTHRSSGGVSSRTTSRVTLPSCTLTTNKASYNLNDTITYSWTSNNATYAAWKQEDDSGKDHLDLPGDKLDTSGSNEVTARVIGSPSATLIIYNTSGNATCSKTVTVTNITEPTAEILTSSQITATSPYIMGTASGVNQVGLSLISESGDKVYGSGLIPVVNDGWSVTVTPALSLGNYTIYVYDANNNELTNKIISIVSSN